MQIENFFKEKLNEKGFTVGTPIDSQNLVIYDQVRAMCKANTCRNYGRSWSCPPGVGNLNACREECAKYRGMLLFTRVFTIDGSFDFEGMMAAGKEFRIAVDEFFDEVKDNKSQFRLFSIEGCRRCKTCTYPRGGCRFPEKLFPSLESYGFMVAELAEKSGLTYNNGEGTVSYFGALLYK